MKKIVFTICSNNYLAQAKILVDSFFEHNEQLEYTFVIGLCDRKSELMDYSFLKNCTIIEVEKINIPFFDEMSLKYNIVELNTSVKPFYFSYLFEKFDADLIYFLDPDICIYDSFQTINEEMAEHDILLTPHLLTPIPLDGFSPEEDVFLNFGLYCLGFLALKKSTISYKLLQWLSSKLEKNCYMNVSEGYFVDQLPMNFAPIYFDKVKISRNYGLNVAWWNLHERTISMSDGKYKINEKSNLVFYHFSSYKVENKDEISQFLTRFTMEEIPFVKQLIATYYDRLIENKYFELKNIPCYYVPKREEYLENLRVEALKMESFRKKVMKAIKKRMPGKINRVISKYSRL